MNSLQWMLRLFSIVRIRISFQCPIIIIIINGGNMLWQNPTMSQHMTKSHHGGKMSLILSFFCHMLGDHHHHHHHQNDDWPADARWCNIIIIPMIMINRQAIPLRPPRPLSAPGPWPRPQDTLSGQPLCPISSSSASTPSAFNYDNHFIIFCTPALFVPCSMLCALRELHWKELVPWGCTCGGAS